MPGRDLPHVATVEDVLARRFVPGQKVLIVDLLDRQPALTTALALAVAGHEVEIVTAATFVGAKLEPQTYAQLYRMALPLGVRLTPALRHHRVRGRRDHGAAEFHPRAGIAARFRQRDRCGTRRRGGWAIPLPYPAACRRSIKLAIAYTPRDVEAAVLEGHAVARGL